MALSTINIGAAANDGTGDAPRTAFTKVNANFSAIAAVAGVFYSDGSGNFSAATSAQMLATLGTMPLANGGTGAATAAAARTNLGAAGLADSNTFAGATNTFAGTLVAGTLSITPTGAGQTISVMPFAYQNVGAGFSIGGGSQGVRFGSSGAGTFTINRSDATPILAASISQFDISNGMVRLAGTDNGISRTGAAAFALGNGTQNDASGSLKLASLTASGPSKLGVYTVSGLPAASAWSTYTATVSNPASGKSSLITSNATNWLYQDGSIAA